MADIIWLLLLPLISNEGVKYNCISGRTYGNFHDLVNLACTGFYKMIFFQDKPLTLFLWCRQIAAKSKRVENYSTGNYAAYYIAAWEKRSHKSQFIFNKRWASIWETG